MAKICNDFIPICARAYDIKRYGLECAVMKYKITNFFGEIQANRKVVKEGKTSWFSLSDSDLKFMCYWWSKNKSREILQRLVDHGVMKSRPVRPKAAPLFAFVKNVS